MVNDTKCKPAKKKRNTFRKYSKRGKKISKGGGGASKKRNMPTSSTIAEGSKRPAIKKSPTKAPKKISTDGTVTNYRNILGRGSYGTIYATNNTNWVTKSQISDTEHNPIDLIKNEREVQDKLSKYKIKLSGYSLITNSYEFSQETVELFPKVGNIKINDKLIDFNMEKLEANKRDYLKDPSILWWTIIQLVNIYTGLINQGVNFGHHDLKFNNLGFKKIGDKLYPVPFDFGTSCLVVGEEEISKSQFGHCTDDGCKVMTPMFSEEKHALLDIFQFMASVYLFSTEKEVKDEILKLLCSGHNCKLKVCDNDNINRINEETKPSKDQTKNEQSREFKRDILFNDFYGMYLEYNAKDCKYITDYSLTELSKYAMNRIQNYSKTKTP